MSGELNARLHATVAAALGAVAYRRPTSPNTVERDAAFDAATARICAEVTAGWAVEPHADGSPADALESLRSCIRYGVMSWRYAPPRSRQADELRRYHERIAEHVVSHLLRSAWLVEPPATLRKKPPTLMHGTPPGWDSPKGR